MSVVAEQVEGSSLNPRAQKAGVSHNLSGSSLKKGAKEDGIEKGTSFKQKKAERVCILWTTCLHEIIPAETARIPITTEGIPIRKTAPAAAKHVI